MVSVLSVVVGLLFIVYINDEVKALPRKSSSKPGFLADQNRIRTVNEPVIGILTQETTGKISKLGSGQYLLTSYVNMVEAAGGQAVPFLINKTTQQVEQMFNSINGVIFPGGHVKLQHSKYGKVGKQIFELAKKANDKGSVFPIWSECLGLELIALLASGKSLAKGQYDTSLFNYTYSKNLTAPLTLAKDYKSSRLFGALPPEMVKFMATNLKSWHNHNKAVLPTVFKKYKLLSDMFRVLSTNKDKKGVEFISTMEGKKYPFFLLHWHPTKAQFEQPNSSDVDHKQEEVWNAKFLTNVFINLARTSDHVFMDQNAKNAALISSYPVTRNEEVDGYFIPM